MTQPATHPQVRPGLAKASRATRRDVLQARRRPVTPEEIEPDPMPEVTFFPQDDKVAEEG